MCVRTQATFEGVEKLAGRQCERWREHLGSQVVDWHVDVTTGAPVRVQVGTVEQTDALTVPDVTYDVLQFDATSPPESAFHLPQDVSGGEGACERQPNDIGFPYVHFFHHFYHA
jgi:hypothetical protein